MRGGLSSAMGDCKPMIDKIAHSFKKLIVPWPGSTSATEDGISGLKQNMPLVPAGSISGRALVTVIAIMTYLAAFVTGFGVFVHSTSRDWTRNISQEMTIQVRPAINRDIEVEVAKAANIASSSPGVKAVRVFAKNESHKLLEPWLGSGLDLGELPIPRLIVVELAGDQKFNPEKLKQTLQEQTPTASLDDHRFSLESLEAMAQSLVFIVGMILALVLVAMAMAVGFATRGAMSGNKEIVDVLHFVGAEDRFIAREFQRHFLRLGFRGGAIGVVAVFLTFMLFSFISTWWAQSPGGDQIDALFGTFSLKLAGYIAILAIGLGIALLTGTVSRVIVFRHLRGLN